MGNPGKCSLEERQCMTAQCQGRFEKRPTVVAQLKEIPNLSRAYEKCSTIRNENCLDLNVLVHTALLPAMAATTRRRADVEMFMMF